jgi:uncharacterized membrane protein (DUF4010 family)
MEPSYDIVITLGVSLAIGLLIGIERGWSDRDGGEGERIAGIRTFSLIGLLGAVVALLAQETGPWFLGIAFAAVSVLITAAHILDVRADKDLGTTTAFTMMLCFVLAAWAAYGHHITAVAATVVVISLLGCKPVLHSWLKKITPRDFFAGAKLLIISLVFLPLLPNQGYGPWQALNPYWTWWMVVVISGLSFVGYVVIQVYGRERGTLLTAVAGGLASSTAVTISLARFAREGSSAGVFIGGFLLASTIMFLRVLIEVLVVNPALLHPLWAPLVMMAAGLLALFFWFWREADRRGRSDGHSIDLENPLQLGMALKFAGLLAVVLLLSEAMQEWFGNSGVYALAVISGIMDVDAITLSLARSAQQQLGAEVATLGIVLACATNTLVKGLLFAVIAGFRQHYQLPLLVAAAITPGLLVALLLL